MWTIAYREVRWLAQFERRRLSKQKDSVGNQTKKRKGCSLIVIPQHVYRGLTSHHNNQNCVCGMCIPIGSDWSDLSNTEKLTKMIILKAQIAAETNAAKTEP